MREGEENTKSFKGIVTTYAFQSNPETRRQRYTWCAASVIPLDYPFFCRALHHSSIYVLDDEVCNEAQGIGMDASNSNNFFKARICSSGGEQMWPRFLVALVVFFVFVCLDLESILLASCCSTSNSGVQKNMVRLVIIYWMYIFRCGNGFLCRI